MAENLAQNLVTPGTLALARLRSSNLAHYRGRTERELAFENEGIRGSTKIRQITDHQERKRTKKKRQASIRSQVRVVLEEESMDGVRHQNCLG